jgi:hypothetical protein
LFRTDFLGAAEPASPPIRNTSIVLEHETTRMRLSLLSGSGRLADAWLELPARPAPLPRVVVRRHQDDLF